MGINNSPPASFIAKRARLISRFLLWRDDLLDSIGIRCRRCVSPSPQHNRASATVGGEKYAVEESAVRRTCII